MRVFDESGVGWLLGKHIATGAEGSVFLVQDRPEWCVKLYHNRLLVPDKVAKLEFLRTLPTVLGGCAALPLSRVSDAPGSAQWRGVLLPFVDGYDIYELYNPQGRIAHFKKATFEFVLAAALHLARAFDALHAHGMVMGDISEQNIRVRPDGTVMFIDTDSFQLSVGARVFPAHIGTPIWTPPELQGLSLAGMVRTRNHDRFGLAQLIFLLLFGGRYPFAGRPISGRDLSPEEAIAKYAFAFDPAPAPRLLDPPPGAPSLEAFPSHFTELFLRAFRRGSEQTDARPSPREWAAALAQLRERLVRCSAWDAHMYAREASRCPWCDVLERTGCDLFPGPPSQRGKAGAERAASSEVETLLRRLRSLKAEPLYFSSPTESTLREALHESGALHPAWWVTVSREMGPLGRLLRKGHRRSLLAELEEARRRVALFASEAAKLYLGYAGALNALEKRANALADALETAEGWPHQASREFQSKHREAALKRYLEGFLLRRYEIQGLTLGRKAALLSHNIVTAFDVTLETVRAVPGFSQQWAERLVRWRQDCERGFRYAAPRVLPESVLEEARETAKRQTMTLTQQGVACLREWENVSGAYAGEHRLLQSEYREACTRLAGLEANLSILG